MDEKFQHILQQSIRMFNRYGIRSISMDDICHELAISKKTLYQFVNNKSELVEHMLAFQGQAVETLFLQVKSLNLNSIDTLLEFSKGLGQLLREFKTNPALEFDLMKYYPDIYKKHIDSRNKAMSKHIKENLRQGIKEELYRNDLNPDLIAGMYIKKMEDILDPDFFPEGKYSYKLIFKTMFVNHIRGISNENGIAYFETKCQNKCL
jgi:AcrR family transcriptional regulator